MIDFRKKRKLAVCLFLLIAGSGSIGWWKIANSSPRSDEREVQGAIYSVATGVTSETGEIAVAGGYIRKDADSFTRLICCYLAKSGRILWQLTDSEFPELEGLELHLEIDASGDVIVVSDRQQNGEGIESTITKLSGSTGRILWEKPLNIQRTTHSRRFKLVELHRPVIDRSGNI